MKTRQSVSPRSDRRYFRVTTDLTRKANVSLISPRGGFRF